MRVPGRVAHLLLALVPLALLLAAAEALVRATGAAERCPGRFGDAVDPDGLWVCDPILHFRVNPSVRPRGEALSRDGFRSAELGPKRAGAFRVLALGDSCTFGYLATGRLGFVAQPYPRRLERIAARARGPGRLEAFNAGQPGYNSRHGVLLLRTRLRGLEPDLVTVRYGWNDHFLSPPGSEAAFRPPRSRAGRAAEALLLRTQLYAFVRRLGLELDAWRRPTLAPARASGPSDGGAWRPTIPLPDFEANLREIVALARDEGAEVWLLTAPANPAPDAEATARVARANRLDFARLLAVHEEYADAVRRVCRETGAPVVDLAKLYAARAGEPLFLPSDAVHPAQGGHELEARVLFELLERSGALGAEAVRAR